MDEAVAEQQRQHEQDQEKHEQETGNRGEAACGSTKAEQSEDKRQNGED